MKPDSDFEVACAAVWASTAALACAPLALAGATFELIIGLVAGAAILGACFGRWFSDRRSSAAVRRILVAISLGAFTGGLGSVASLVGLIAIPTALQMLGGAAWLASDGWFPIWWLALLFGVVGYLPLGVVAGALSGVLLASD